MEGLFLLKEILLKGDYMCKIDSKDAYFLVPLNPKFQTFVSFKWKDLIYQFFARLWQIFTSPQDIYKTTEGSHFSDTKVECSINNFSGRYFTDCRLGGGVDTGTGHSHLPASGFRFSYQDKETCA